MANHKHKSWRESGWSNLALRLAADLNIIDDMTPDYLNPMLFTNPCKASQAAIVNAAQVLRRNGMLKQQLGKYRLTGGGRDKAIMLFKTHELPAEPMVWTHSINRLVADGVGISELGIKESAQ